MQTLTFDQWLNLNPELEEQYELCPVCLGECRLDCQDCNDYERYCFSCEGIGRSICYECEGNGKVGVNLENRYWEAVRADEAKIKQFKETGEVRIDGLYRNGEHRLYGIGDHKKYKHRLVN